MDATEDAGARLCSGATSMRQAVRAPKDSRCPRSRSLCKVATAKSGPARQARSVTSGARSGAIRDHIPSPFSLARGRGSSVRGLRATALAPRRSPPRRERGGGEAPCPPRGRTPLRHRRLPSDPSPSTGGGRRRGTPPGSQNGLARSDGTGHQFSHGVLYIARVSAYC